MNTALVVAIISGVVALVSVSFSAWTQLRVAKREREGKAEDRRSAAKVALDKYRGPLLDAAWQLGDRLDSIRHRGFLAYLSEGSGREQDAKLTALFRFAHYFGWREFVRMEVQLLRFENEEDTRLAAGSSTMALLSRATARGSCSGRCTGSSGSWTKRAPTAASGPTGARLRSVSRHSTEVLRGTKNC